METNYDVDYFIEKFSAIPDSRWFMGDYFSDDGTRACALGHCCQKQNWMTTERKSLELLFSTITTVCVGDVNDDTIDNLTEYQSQ